MNRRCFAALFLFWTFGLFALVGDESAVPVDENLVVLLSDIHIGVDAMKTGYAADNDLKLSAIIDKILAMNPRPAHLLIFGDLAYEKGTVADYQSLIKPLFARFDDAHIEWTAALGNHDRRAPFAEVFPEKAAGTELTGRLVSVVETPRCDFILLDSLREGSVESCLDDAQNEWLAKKLAEYEKSGKRVYVGAHHPSDEAGFLETIQNAPNVTGYIFGHWHKWSRPEIGNVEHFCLPSTAYREPPLGFMTLALGENEDVFTLITNDADDENNNAAWTNPF